MKEQIEKPEIRELTNELIFTSNYGTRDAVAKYLYEKGYRKQKWISVEERLPEKEGDYLVWNKDQKKIEIRFFHRLPPHYPVESHPEIREYFGNFADYKRITHWMPLPEAPKGGAE